MSKALDRFSVYFSTLFGIGFFPKAPGTAGTFFALLIYLILPKYFFAEMSYQFILLGILSVLSIISVYFITKSEEKLGHDSSHIVIDEFIGYFVSVLFLPKTFMVGIVAFILFRIFDIFKPEPVDVLQKLPKGLGVLADDVMAGIYSNIILQILIRVVGLKIFTFY